MANKFSNIQSNISQNFLGYFNGRPLKDQVIYTHLEWFLELIVNSKLIIPENFDASGFLDEYQDIFTTTYWKDESVSLSEYESDLISDIDSAEHIDELQIQAYNWRFDGLNQKLKK